MQFNFLVLPLTLLGSMRVFPTHKPAGKKYIFSHSVVLKQIYMLNRLTTYWLSTTVHAS